MRFVFLMVLAAVTSIAVNLVARADVSAGTPRFDWTQPAQWSDGSPLTAAQITGYQLVCTGAASIDRRVTAAGGIPPYQTPAADRFAPGSYTCTLALHARYTPTSPESTGAPSGAVSFTVPQPTPGAPAGFSVD